MFKNTTICTNFNTKTKPCTNIICNSKIPVQSRHQIENNPLYLFKTIHVTSLREIIRNFTRFQREIFLGGLTNASDVGSTAGVHQEFDSSKLVKEESKKLLFTELFLSVK